MKTTCKRNIRRGIGLIVILLFLAFLVVIGICAYLLVKTIYRTVKPPPPDPDGNIHWPKMGSSYLGGTVVVTPNSDGIDKLQVSPVAFTLYVFRSDVPLTDLSAWLTNTVVYQRDFQGNGTQDALHQMGDEFLNGQLMDGQTNGVSSRFYNIVVSNWPAL